MFLNEAQIPTGKFLVNLTYPWGFHNLQITPCPRPSMYDLAFWPTWFLTPIDISVLPCEGSFLVPGHLLFLISCKHTQKKVSPYPFYFWTNHLVILKAWSLCGCPLSGQLLLWDVQMRISSFRVRKMHLSQEATWSSESWRLSSFPGLASPTSRPGAQLLLAVKLSGIWE